MDILNFFSRDINQILSKYNFNGLEEIRIRNNSPIILKYHNNEIILDKIVSTESIMQTLSIMCDNSIYSFQNQICNGFITLNGGHRVGICGNVVFQNDKVVNIKYISSINFRVARQVKGCSDEVAKNVIKASDTIYNTLIVSPPGYGKTTILRDLIRQLSDGIDKYNFLGQTIGVADERGELSAMYKGIPQNNLGIRTDILENVPKSIGMKMIIRSMNPRILCTDEIGSNEDVDAINYAVCCGINLIFTAHGKEFNDLLNNPSLKELIYKYYFDKIIFLTRTDMPGQIKSIYKLDRSIKQYVREER